MRKVFTIVIVCFVVLSIGLVLFFDKGITDHISILTVEQSYQRLITEKEELSITFFINSNDSFITEKDYIDNAYLISSEQEIEISIENIRDLEYQEEFLKTDYFGYCFDIVFKDIQILESEFDLIDCYLVLEYINSETINLEIGDLYLFFLNHLEPGIIDINRMFAIYDFDEFEYISGVYLDLMLLKEDIVIKNISILNKNIKVDIESYIELIDIPSYSSKIDDLLGFDYDSLGDIDNNITFKLSQGKKYLFPLKYVNYLEEINRFPLIIEYECNEETGFYYLDDFQFNNKALGLEVNNGRIREFKYYNSGSNEEI